MSEHLLGAAAACGCLVMWNLLGGCGSEDSTSARSADTPSAQDAGEGDDSSTEQDGDEPWDDADASSEEPGPDASDKGSQPPQDSALCHLAGEQVAVLGDSYVALDPTYVKFDTHPFTRNLEALARSAGALGESEQYRRLAVSGASMNGFPNVPAQLDGALESDPDLKLIIMDGGGNDVLVNNRQCLEHATADELLRDESCVGTVDDVLAAAQGMFDKASAAGVESVVYFFYPHLPGYASGYLNLAGTYPNVMLDYAYPRMQAFCTGQHALPCTFVDMRPVFDTDGDGAPDPGMINVDGIHPTEASSKLLAAEVWKVMRRECLAVERP
ncbi:MAG: SGNH/GDSL hydrolase family protein [Myxococcales bacterium]